jgi:hypothetical protein
MNFIKSTLSFSNSSDKKYLDSINTDLKEDPPSLFLIRKPIILNKKKNVIALMNHPYPVVPKVRSLDTRVIDSIATYDSKIKRMQGNL